MLCHLCLPTLAALAAGCQLSKVRPQLPLWMPDGLDFRSSMQSHPKCTVKVLIIPGQISTFCQLCVLAVAGHIWHSYAIIPVALCQLPSDSSK